MKLLHKLSIITIFIITFGFCTTINVPADYSTIQEGIDASSDGDTVLVAPGLYVENLDIDIGDEYNNYWGSIMLCSEFVYYPDSTSIIQNTIIMSNSISSNYGDHTVYGFTIKENIYLDFNYYYSNPTFINCLINNGGLWQESGSDFQVFQNCTLLNSFNYPNSDITTIVNNSILISSFTNDDDFDDVNQNDNMSFTHNDLGFNENGNIFGLTPLFCNPDSGDYTLAENSPCVGTGENGVNIGALGVGCDAFDISLTINEIMQNPSAVSDNDGEWFEIFNSGEIELDLNGWTIKDAGSDNHTISSSLTINPGEYKVIGINSNTGTNGGVNIDYQYSGSSNDITLSNGADEIILVDTYGVVFDSVAYDGGPDNDGGIFPDPNGASMALVHPDSNNNVGTNWHESTTSYGDGDLGTPGIPNFSSDISIDLTPLDFDTVFVNESGTLDLTITNNGNAPLQIDSLYTSSDLFTLSIDNSLIETSAILSITYTPVEFGPDTGTAYIKSNDPDEGLVQISLSGFGYFLSPDIELSTNSINFGDVMDGLTGIQSLHVYNTGDAALELDTMYCTDNFSVAPSNGTVNIGDTLTLEVTFAPDDEAFFTGNMVIVSNDPDEDTLTVSLSGTGTQQAPIMELSDNSLYFGIVVAGQTVTRQTTIYNVGMLGLEVEEITMEGSDLFTTTFSDATVEPGDSVDVVFQFAPTEQVPEAIATVTIVASGVANQTVTLEAGYFGPVWYVATTGSDDNYGNEETPFATVQRGIDASINSDTVLVLAGTYVENINYNGKNIVVGSLFLSTSDTSYISSTVIDGNQNGTVVSFESGEDNTAVLSGFTIQNGMNLASAGGIYCWGSSPSLENLTISGNSAGLGGGIWCYGSSSPSLKNLTISGNSAISWGGGICVMYNSNPSLENVKITNNYTDDCGGGIFYDMVSLGSSLNNVTITNNYAGDDCDPGWEGEGGGGIAVRATTFNGYVSLVNCVLWNNLPDEIYSQSQNNEITVSYSDIQGGWEGEGNIDADPLFCNPENGDYTLATNSPCVGTGEYGANMGALDVGCGPYNFSPTEFSLSTPSNNAQITIDDSNMSDGFITFSWGESSDENGDSLVYLMHATSTDLEDFSLDTNITSIDMLNYMEIVDEMSENNITSATIEWTVDVTDGIDTVTANNAPFTLIVDGSDALSALAEKLIPEVFALRQNYPNPFNPTTQIRYDLPEDALVAINIYDIMGRSIRSLVNSKQTAGYRSIQWNATNNLGEPVSAGMYIYMIQAGEFRQTKKMVLLK